MEQNKPHTAVEWLLENLGMAKIKITEENLQRFFEVRKKAKEMEKERMIKFGSKVAEKWGLTTVEAPYIEKFYNETYGKQ